MSIKKKTALVILAGGESKRMDNAKQLLPWKDSNLLGNAIEQGLASEVDTVFVVLGARYQEIKKNISHFPITIIKNNQWKSGIGTSISCGVNYIMNDLADYKSLIIGLSDMPFISATHFNSLIDTSELSDKNIIATTSSGIIGVPALFSSLYFKNLTLLDKDRGAKRLIKQYEKDVFILDIGDKGIDIDTQEDYNKLINNG